MVTDEGSGFFDDLKKKESKHESDLSLLNQLYDGKGDKTTLAQNHERSVPANATSITVSIQQEAYINELNNLGKTLWLDNGFGERFLVNAIKPHRYYKLHKIYYILNKCETFEMIPYVIYIFLNRYMFGENRKAATEMMEKYDPD